MNIDSLITQFENILEYEKRSSEITSEFHEHRDETISNLETFLEVMREIRAADKELYTKAWIEKSLDELKQTYAQSGYNTRLVELNDEPYEIPF